MSIFEDTFVEWLVGKLDSSSFTTEMALSKAATYLNTVKTNSKIQFMEKVLLLLAEAYVLHVGVGRYTTLSNMLTLELADVDEKLKTQEALATVLRFEKKRISRELDKAKWHLDLYEVLRERFLDALAEYSKVESDKFLDSLFVFCVSTVFFETSVSFVDLLLYYVGDQIEIETYEEIQNMPSYNVSLEGVSMRDATSLLTFVIDITIRSGASNVASDLTGLQSKTEKKIYGPYNK